jgi:hypothetical protein
MEAVLMRLIDVDALPRLMQIFEANGKRREQEVVLGKIIDNAPTVYAVPVVRCKDCVYRVIVRDPLMGTMDCYGCRVMRYNEDDWFCSFGERRDDEADRR